METKKCPYCAEEIRSDARKCRFCNEYLDDGLRSERLGSSTLGATASVAAATAIAPKAAGVFCMECGRPMEESQASCLGCGSKVNLASAPAASQQQSQAVPSAADVGAGADKSMFWVIVVALVILVFVISRC
jgi:hypothetical protein